MISLDEKIERTRRLLRRLEEDQPLLAMRVADLEREHQESAKSFVAEMMAQTRAELEKLKQQQAKEFDISVPAPAD
jgi:hypothetical protein